MCYGHVLSLELSIKTILKHYIQRSSESLTSDHLMSPNKLFSCDCNFYATHLKDKSPVYYTMYLVRQGVKGGRLYEGEARSLNEHYPITAHVPNLDFLTGC